MVLGGFRSLHVLVTKASEQLGTRLGKFENVMARHVQQKV